MPVGVKVILLGDRGFIDTQLMKYARQQLGWSYRIRIKSDFWIWRSGKGSGQSHLIFAHADCIRGFAIAVHLY